MQWEVPGAQGTGLADPKVPDPQSRLFPAGEPLRPELGPARPSTVCALLTLGLASAQNPAAPSLHRYPWNPASQPWRRVLPLKPHKVYMRDRMGISSFYLNRAFLLLLSMLAPEGQSKALAAPRGPLTMSWVSPVPPAWRHRAGQPAPNSLVAEDKKYSQKGLPWLEQAPLLSSSWWGCGRQRKELILSFATPHAKEE